MDVDDIRTLYSFNQWATNRLVEAARRLDAGEFVRDLGTSYGSVRGTLVHTMWAEWIWLRRWRGESPRRQFDERDYPDLETIQSRWQEIDDDRRDFIGALTPERLRTRLAYENLQGQRWEYPLVQMMQHVVNHSSYHRGQVVTLLRQLGQKPPSTDFLVYFDEGGN
jgi:uncharacterized damage-inducible protein DinB